MNVCHQPQAAVVRNLTARYLLALTVVGILVATSYALMQKQIQTTRSLAAVVDLSGRQRALLQRSGLLAGHLINAPRAERSGVRAELNSAIDDLERAHLQLIEHTDGSGAMLPAIEALYFRPPWHLDEELRGFIAEVRALARAPDNALSDQNPHYQQITAGAEAGRVAQGLDLVVMHYQRASQTETAHLLRLSTWSLAVLVGVLGAMGVFVFRPMAKRVGRVMHSLHTLNTTLEQRVEERTELAERRARELAASERELRKQTELLRLILESMGDGVVVARDVSSYLLLNPAARRMLHLRNGGPPPSLPSAPPSLLETWREEETPEDDQHLPPHAQPLARALRGEAVDRCEIQLPDSAGSTWLSINARPLHGEGDQLRGAVAVLRDITERKSAEAALKDSEALYRSLVDNLPLCVLRKDLQGRFTFVNELFCQSLSRPAEAILGRNDYDFYPRALADKYRQDDRRVIDTGQVMAEVEEHEGPHGDLQYVETLKAPLRDHEGHIVGTQTVFWDVTDRRQAEHRALRAERLAAIGQMVAGVAHESRNALQQIHACASLLEWEFKDNASAMELVADLHAAQERLLRLFEDLRGFAAPLNLERHPVDLRDTVQQAWQSLQGKVADRQAELALRSDARNCVCPADAYKLEQVFRNLFENALAACPPAARIEVHLRERLVEQQEALQVIVRDNGPGFSAEQLRRLFEAFFTTKAEGTGLGMAIVQRIVEAHGGTIAAANASDGGAEISFFLPRAG